MIHCIYCGKALEDDAAFCSACGKRVILESKESGRSESQGGSGKMSLDAMLAKESESPSAELEWQIGDSYFSGTNGAVKDYGEAVRWLEKASSRKHPAAQYALACCYANGLGTEKSDEAAFSLFRVAEENGFAGASLNVAQCFAEGRGVQKNPFRAAVRYIRMILDGDAQAVSRLRALYDSGENLVSDISESYREAHLIRKKETAKNTFSKISSAFSQDILKDNVAVVLGDLFGEAFDKMLESTTETYTTDAFDVFAENFIRNRSYPVPFPPANAGFSASDYAKVLDVFYDESRVRYAEAHARFFHNSESMAQPRFKTYAASAKGDDPSFLTLSYKAGGMEYTMYEWSVDLNESGMKRNADGICEFLGSIANMSEPGEEGKRVGQALADDFMKKHRKELKAMEKQESGSQNTAIKIVLWILAGVFILFILPTFCSI